MRKLPHGYVIGLLDGPIRLLARGIVKSVTARFYAWGFYPLSKNDMLQLRNAIRPLEIVERGNGLE